MTDKKVKVKVEYTGHDPFEHEFPNEETIGEIKKKALHKFEIEKEAGEKYILQHNGVTLGNDVRIGELKHHEVTLVLLLKEPQPKGYVG